MLTETGCTLQCGSAAEKAEKRQCSGFEGRLTPRGCFSGLESESLFQFSFPYPVRFLCMTGVTAWRPGDLCVVVDLCSDHHVNL